MYTCGSLIVISDVQKRRAMLKNNCTDATVYSSGLNPLLKLVESWRMMLSHVLVLYSSELKAFIIFIRNFQQPFRLMKYNVWQWNNSDSMINCSRNWTWRPYHKQQPCPYLENIHFSRKVPVGINPKMIAQLD